MIGIEQLLVYPYFCNYFTLFCRLCNEYQDNAYYLF